MFIALKRMLLLIKIPGKYVDGSFFSNLSKVPVCNFKKIGERNAKLIFLEK